MLSFEHGLTCNQDLLICNQDLVGCNQDLAGVWEGVEMVSVICIAATNKLCQHSYWNSLLFLLVAHI